MSAKVQDHATNEASDSRIVVRFGDRMLDAGHTAVPNLVLRHYARLGVTPAELVFVLEVWTFWWSERDPFPSLGTIADRMGISRRQARNYVHSLKERGHLAVTERSAPGRGQLTSEYDFGPFLDAVRKLDSKGNDPRNDPSGGTPGKEASEGPRNSSSPEEDEEEKDSALASKATHAGEKKPQERHELQMPYDRNQNRPRTATGTSSVADQLKQRVQRSDARSSHSPGIRPAPVHIATPYLDQIVSELSEAIGDSDHLRSNLARVRRIKAEYALDESGTVAALLRAHSLLKARSREGNKPVRRAGAYLFAILEDMLAASRSKHSHENGSGSIDNDGSGVSVLGASKRPE